MRGISLLLLLAVWIVMPVSASEFTAPPVPDSADYMMPESQDFASGLYEMIQNAFHYISPDLTNAMKTGIAAVTIVLIIGLVQSFGADIESICELVGIAAISSTILLNTNGMIALGVETVTEISEYGKLLLPVLTAALAAQGGVSTSAALYAGTAVFNAVISGALSTLLKPLVYCYIALSIAMAAIGEPILKNMRDLVKTFTSWCLKILLTVFTTYMSITGVISGTTDAAALKAAKVTISSFVPMVGSILSDASEAVLLSASLAKNAAGIYGIFAILAVFLVPFLRISVHYLTLKVTSALCSILGTKRMGDLIGDFSAAMGLLLAMTGSACLIQLISTVCFLKGVS